MRRTYLILLLGLALAMLCVGPAWGQASSFSDDFGSFDTVRWSKGVHTLGRSYLDPANVDVDGQNLRIKLPARSYEGGDPH